MILALALLVLAVLGAPLFALLALTSLTGFLEALSGAGWVAPALDALGRRGLNSPELVAAPLLLLLRRRRGATQEAGRCVATLALAAVFVGVVLEVPLRSLAWALLLPGAAVVLGTKLVRTSAWRPDWQLLVSATLLVGFLGGWLLPHEAAALGALGLFGADMLRAEPLPVRRLVGGLVTAGVQAGAWCGVMAAWLGVQALWEPSANVESQRLAVCVVLAVELLRVLRPTLERLGAAYLGERYGAPMDRAVRAQAALIALLLVACSAWPDLTAWLPRTAS
jgi:hypothetical protein